MKAEEAEAMSWAQRARRKRSENIRWNLAVSVFVILCAVAVALCAWIFLRPQGQTGTRIIDAGNMSVEEAQALVDEQVEKSRITVSIAPAPEFDSEEEMLRVNFAVVPGNNGYSERFQIEQDHRVIYTSEVIEPDHMVEWVRAPGAHPGTAIATVYAVDALSGQDWGNPVSVELDVVESAS